MNFKLKPSLTNLSLGTSICTKLLLVPNIGFKSTLGLFGEYKNFPSIFKKGRDQASFFAWLSNVTQCGLLFDISNFVIASKNIGTSLNE